MTEQQLDFLSEQVAGVDGKTIYLNLPQPPSVNHYKGRRMIFPGEAAIRGALAKGSVMGLLRSKTFMSEYLTERAKEYRENVATIVAAHNLALRLTEPLRMEVRFYPPDRRKRDLSNIYKCVEDAMQAAGVFEDDYQIEEHVARREKEIVAGGLVRIRLTILS